MSLYIVIISKFLIHLPLILQLVFLVISGALIYFLALFVLGVFNKNDIIKIIQN